jgi:hypothetical protein
MPNFFVPTFICLFPFFMFIGISKASPKQPLLSEDPKEFCNYCQELATSDRFKNMISKLQGKIPIDRHALALDKNANVKYSSLLFALKSFMDEAKGHTEVLEKNKGPSDLEDNGYDRANKFINEEHKILKEICGTRKTAGMIGSRKTPVIAGTVLNEALTCANGVNESPEPEQTPTDKEGNNGKSSKDCIKLDKKFKVELFKIWLLNQPFDLYQKCHMMPKSPKFTAVIGILKKDKIPIDAKKAAAWGPEGKMTYRTNLLTEMNSFIKEVLRKRGVERMAERIKNCTAKGLTLNEQKRVLHEHKEDRPFLQTHKVSVNQHGD